MWEKKFLTKNNLIPVPLVPLTWKLNTGSLSIRTGSRHPFSRKPQRRRFLKKATTRRRFPPHPPNALIRHRHARVSPRQNLKPLSDQRVHLRRCSSLLWPHRKPPFRRSDSWFSRRHRIQQNASRYQFTHQHVLQMQPHRKGEVFV